MNLFALLHELPPANQGATNLLVDTGQLNHNVIHALAHGQRVRKEVGGHLDDAVSLLEELTGGLAGGVELSGGFPEINKPRLQMEKKKTEGITYLT